MIERWHIYGQLATDLPSLTEAYEAIPALLAEHPLLASLPEHNPVFLLLREPAPGSVLQITDLEYVTVTLFPRLPQGI